MLSCLPVLKRSVQEPGVVVHSCNPMTWESVKFKLGLCKDSALATPLPVLIPPS